MEIVISLILLGLSKIKIPSYEKYLDISEAKKMHITGYLPTGNKTASGTVPTKLTCASSRKHIGELVIISDEDKIVGIYKVEDTGGTKAIKNDKCIDIFFENEMELNQFFIENGTRMYVRYVRFINDD